jgi:maltose O-acetyltransferase
MLDRFLDTLMRVLPTLKAFWCFGKFVNVYGNFTCLGSSRVQVGRDVAINHGVFFQGRCGTIVGDNVTLSARVMLLDGGLKTGSPAEPADDHVALPIDIRNGAWIGAGSIILAGVIIGEDAVVGAGSVVTKSIPAGEVWAGNPARRIK